MLGFIDRLDAAADKLRDCVNDLLELSRAGYVSYQPQRVNLSQLVAKIIQSHELTIRELNVQVEVDEELPTVFFDPQRLEDVLDNLVTNALKYGMSDGSPKLTIRSETSDGECRLCIRDNGDGIDPKYHEKIFNIFERIDNTKGGTGIGLAIVKKIMTSHDGRVWIESNRGEGSAFWLAFPEGSGDHDATTNHSSV